MYKYMKDDERPLVGLTGGDVVLKSSEPAELECEGVRGGMLMGNW